MIYHLFEALRSIDIPGQGLIDSISFRVICASVTSLIVSLAAGRKIIEKLQKKQIGETIRDLGLEGQLMKKGTPTMGGIIILIALLSGVLLFCKLTSPYVILLTVTALWLGGLGFIDDYIKVFKHRKEGLCERAKLVSQIILGFGIALYVCLSSDIDTNHIITTIPFVKSNEFDYSWLSPFKGQLGVYCTWAIYVIMIVIVITACSNGTNLTDGMDGLATGTSAVVAVVLGIFGYLSGNALHSDYLNIMFIPGSGEVAVFMGALVGALMGFLWYNSYPAQVFMGDTGSLMLGGIIGVSAVLVRKELLLPLLCGIFFVESLSVLVQRFHFKRTRKKYGEGRRVLKMAPLHHHFQKEGIEAAISKPEHAHPEAKIVTRFWIVSILLAVLSIALLKIR